MSLLCPLPVSQVTFATDRPMGFSRRSNSTVTHVPLLLFVTAVIHNTTRMFFIRSGHLGRDYRVWWNPDMDAGGTDYSYSMPLAHVLIACILMSTHAILFLLCLITSHDSFVY